MAAERKLIGQDVLGNPVYSGYVNKRSAPMPHQVSRREASRRRSDIELAAWAGKSQAQPANAWNNKLQQEAQNSLIRRAGQEGWDHQKQREKILGAPGGDAFRLRQQICNGIEQDRIKQEVGLIDKNIAHRRERAAEVEKMAQYSLEDRGKMGVVHDAAIHGALSPVETARYGRGNDPAAVLKIAKDAGVKLAAPQKSPPVRDVIKSAMRGEI